LFLSLPVFSSDDAKFLKLRDEMVRLDIEGRGIRDPLVLQVLREIPRHLFVPERLQDVAYGDRPLSIGEGQTISQPYVVAYMTEALQLKGSETVLEIGTGSGYQAAVLSKIVKDVYTMEIREPLALLASSRLKQMGFANVTVKHADGYFGWSEKGPFDAIMITAAVNHIPPSLLRQLKEGGCLILPLGSTTYYQTLVRVTKTKEGFKTERLIDVRFVPMRGEAEKERLKEDKGIPLP
jgi:protein-L-isoaspartate(D-aspartate) O-methyltransferase